MWHRKPRRFATGALRAEALETRLLMSVVVEGSQTTSVSATTEEQIRLLPQGGNATHALIDIIPGSCAADVTIRGDNLSETHLGRDFDITGANFSIDSITLFNTSAKSSLTFNPARGYQISVVDLQSDGVVNSITGNGVNVTGLLTLPGARNVSFLSLSGGSDYVGNSIPTQSFKTGSITGTQLTFAAPVNLFQSGPILPSSGSSSSQIASIAAPYIYKYKVKGDANLNLTLSSGPRYSLGDAEITGSVTGGIWNFDGAVTHLKASSFSNTWHGSFGNRLSFIQTRGAFNGFLQCPTIGSAQFGSADGASIDLTQPFISNLQNLDSLKVTGGFSNSFIRSDGNLGNLNFQYFGTSSVFAGIDPNAQIGILPTVSQLQSKAMIKGFNLSKGGKFMNGYVAGSFLGATNLGTVIPQISGPSFGITTNMMHQLRFAIGSHFLSALDVSRALDLSLAEERAQISPSALGNFAISLSF